MERRGRQQTEGFFFKVIFYVQRYQTHKRLNSSVCVCLPDSFTKTLCSTCLHNQHSPNVYVYVFQPHPPHPPYTRLLCHDFSQTSIHASHPAARLYNPPLGSIEPHSGSCVSGGLPAPPLSFKPGCIGERGRGCPRCFCSSAALGWRPRLPSRGQITVVTTSWRLLNSQGLLRGGGGPSGRQTPRRSATNKPTSGLRSGAVPGD